MAAATLTVTALLGCALVLARQRVATRRRELRLKKLLKACEDGFGFPHGLSVGSREWSLEDDAHWSPIIMASKGGHKVLVAWLIDHVRVTNVNPAVSETHSALRAASLGGHGFVCELLLDRGGAFVDVLSAGKRTPLMGAAMNGHSEICALLLKRGASTSLVNSTGETARDLAKDDQCRALLWKE